jgi:ectoine hydroxylase-related dioxygenase (phytanoyl-CoA dioxygenase family)
MIGSEIAGHPVWNIRCKTPRNPLAVCPWHQDAAYFWEGTEHTLIPSAWIPFLDVNEKNGCLKMLRGGHSVKKCLEHHQVKKVGNPKSWYVFIDEKDLPEGEPVTCEMRMGSVLFFNQLIPHCSTDNYTDRIRWAFDFRWQRPDDPTGIKTAKSIPMKTKRDPDYRVQWPEWTKRGRTELSIDAQSSDKPGECLNIDVKGPWLDRWPD